MLGFPTEVVAVPVVAVAVVEAPCPVTHPAAAATAAAAASKGSGAWEQEHDAVVDQHAHADAAACDPCGAWTCGARLPVHVCVLHQEEAGPSLLVAAQLVEEVVQHQKGS